MSTIRHFMCLFITLISLPLLAQKTEWKIDQSHSNVGFSISHFVMATVKGQFDRFQGNISTPNATDFKDAKLAMIIESTSINTNDKKRDEHLSSADFFNVAVNPEISFVSTSFTFISGKKYKVAGNLSMNGITKKVVLDVTYKGTFEHPVYKKTISAFDIFAEIPRLDFKIGSTYPPAVLGEFVTLNSTVEIIKN